MEYEVIDNYLSKEEYQIIHDEIVGNNNFAMYISTGVSHDTKPKDWIESVPWYPTDGYYFTHHLYSNNQPNSGKFSLVLPLLERLDPFAINRIKVNFYPNTSTVIEHGWHIDHDIPHKGAVYYLNTNNGKTILEDGTEIDSVANRMLFFDPTVKHKSTTCSDNFHGRYNINFNFI